MTAILAIAGVVAGYLPQVDILNGVDVHVDEGELVVVVGPNGAGKSTLLKLVIGLLAPKRGTVILAGEAIAGLPPSRIVRQGLGYVPQRENIFEGLPVEENLEIGLRPRRDLRLADRLEALYALFPRLEERRRQLAGNLSGGVGTCCVQLAKQAGATVIACASSEEKLARLKALGADVGLDYTATDWVAECRRLFERARVFGRDEGGIDVVVNFTGGDSWVPSLRVMRRGERLLTCGATAGYDPAEDLRLIWTFELNIVGSNDWSRDDVLALLELVRRGTMVPALHPERFPLKRAATAVGLLDERRVYGKVVIEP